jgi:hypothetical protein
VASFQSWAPGRVFAAAGRSGLIVGLVALAIGMAEIAFRIDDVAHELLELGRLGKAAVSLALPDQSGRCR